MTASYDKNPCRKGLLTILKEAFLLIITKYFLLICSLDGEKHLKDLN